VSFQGCFPSGVLRKAERGVKKGMARGRTAFMGSGENRGGVLGQPSIKFVPQPRRRKENGFPLTQREKKSTRWLLFRQPQRPITKRARKSGRREKKKRERRNVSIGSQWGSKLDKEKPGEGLLLLG